MNYYQARQLKTGGWHFTCQNNNKVWPVGFCVEHAAHKTKQEAESCYRSYVLSNVNFNILLTESLTCSFCKRKTKKAVNIDSRILPLCNSHCNKETLEKKYDMGDKIISSY
jgi:hypothetical protein